MYSLIRTLFLAVFILGIAACGELETSTEATAVSEVAAPTSEPLLEATSEPILEAPADTDSDTGDTATTGENTGEILSSGPTLEITELVDFTHEETGMSGLQPKDWTLFPSQDSFQISSSPESVGGFIGALMPVEEGQYETAREGLLSSLKTNHPDAGGPEPEILNEEINDDGSGSIEVKITGPGQDSDPTMYRFQAYARVVPIDGGLIFTVAMFPEAQFNEHYDLIHEMADSVYLSE